MEDQLTSIDVGGVINPGIIDFCNLDDPKFEGRILATSTAPTDDVRSLTISYPSF